MGLVVTSTTSSVSSASGASTRTLKSKRDTQDTESGDSDDSCSKRSRKRSVKSERKSTRRLACPFYQHDPWKYGANEKRGCGTTGWEEIARLKEHLTRSHNLKNYCSTCLEEFSSSERRDDHVRSNNCEKEEEPPPGRIAPGISDELRRRGPKRSQSTRERWDEIYGMLFPREPIPSPYFEPTQDRPSIRHLEHLEDYMRREIPERVCATLEKYDFKVREDIRDIIDGCQAQAFQDYKKVSGLEASSSRESLPTRTHSLPRPNSSMRYKAATDCQAPLVTADRESIFRLTDEYHVNDEQTSEPLEHNMWRRVSQPYSFTPSPREDDSFDFDRTCLIQFQSGRNIANLRDYLSGADRLSPADDYLGWNRAIATNYDVGGGYEQNTLGRCGDESIFKGSDESHL